LGASEARGGGFGGLANAPGSSQAGLWKHTEGIPKTRPATGKGGFRIPGKTFNQFVFN
jgi:hypothetical protein